MTFEELQQLRLQSKDLQEFKKVGKTHKLNFSDEETEIYYHVLGEMNAEIAEADLMGISGGKNQENSRTTIFKCPNCQKIYTMAQYCNYNFKCPDCNCKCERRYKREIQYA